MGTESPDDQDGLRSLTIRNRVMLKMIEQEKREGGHSNPQEALLAMLIKAREAFLDERNK